MCRSQWEENQSKLPQNTPSTGEHTRRPVITNSHTHSRGSGRTGETLATESLPKTAAPAQSPVRGSPRFTEPTPPGWTNFSRSSSPRSASWCPRERRCLKVRAAALPRMGSGRREGSVKPRARASRDSVLVLESRVKFKGQRRNANDGFCALI